MLPFFGPLASHRDVPRMCGPSGSEVCLLKTPKAQEVSVSRAMSYCHRHDHASVRPRFPALVPGSYPHRAGTPGTLDAARAPITAQVPHGFPGSRPTASFHPVSEVYRGGMSDDQMSASLLTILPRVVAVDNQGAWLRRKLQ